MRFCSGRTDQLAVRINYLALENDLFSLPEITATFGTIGEFKAEEKEWSLYVERMQHYFAANDITSMEKQWSIMLSVCGASTYKLMSSLFAPRKLRDVPFSELVKVVEQHRNPRPSVIVQPYKLNIRSQEGGESILDYVAALRKLAERCEHGSNLKEMLQYRLVCGVMNDRIQRRLLTETTLDSDKALNIAS